VRCHRPDQPTHDLAERSAPPQRRNWSTAVKVSFVRHRGHRDHIYVTRTDGSSTDWGFPSYGDDLPHDLCHLVVEDGLGIAHGFWGLVDEGMDVQLVDNQATLVRDGNPLIEDPSVDFSDLKRAEQAVALLAPVGIHAEQVGALAVVRLGPPASGSSPASQLSSRLGFELPEGTSEETLSLIRARLDDLRCSWRSLDDGATIILTYPGRGD
jgi:hypothetical protein